MSTQLEVINLTAVPVTVVPNDGPPVTYPPSGMLARVEETLGAEWRPGSWPFPVREPTSYGAVVGLPFRKPEPTVDELAVPNSGPEVGYIVPLLVGQKLRADWLAACAGPMPEQGERWYELMLKRFRRDDVFTPGEMVRDEQGRIIGARNLVSVYPQLSDGLVGDASDAIAAAHAQARERAGFDLIAFAFKLRKLKDLPPDAAPASLTASAMLAASAFLGSNTSVASSATWPTVAEFAFSMEAQLDANRHKGDRANWMKDAPEDLWRQAARNLEEVEMLTDPAVLGTSPSSESLLDVRRRCVNVANFCMMVADRMGALALVDQTLTPENQAAAQERRQADLVQAVVPPYPEMRVETGPDSIAFFPVKDGDDSSRSE